MALRVLIIDDSPVTRNMLEEMLELINHQVVAKAESVDDALKAYETSKPDVIILDISLIGGSGLTVLKGIRRLDSRARVLIVSGNQQKKVRNQALAAGACGFLYKPLGMQDLESALAGISQDDSPQI